MGRPKLIGCISRTQKIRVNAVSVRRLRVPPLSAQVIDCELAAKLGHFLLESGFPDGLLFPKHLNSPSERGKIWFTAVDHRIDTDDARPVNQLMRRTPTVIH